MLQETAEAFWDHVHNSSSVTELKDVDAFTRAYQEWKAEKASTGRVHRGTAGKVRLTLERMKCFKVVKNLKKKDAHKKLADFSN